MLYRVTAKNDGDVFLRHSVNHIFNSIAFVRSQKNTRLLYQVNEFKGVDMSPFFRDLEY